MFLIIVILSIVLLTTQISQSLQCQVVGSINACLGNKAIEVKVESDYLTCQVTEVSNQKFRDDYKLVAGLGWYKFHPQAKNWNEARKTCESEGAHLAIINSEAEKKVILELVSKEKDSISKAFRTDFTWLGVHNWFGEDDWTTVQGEPLSSTGYVKWSKGCTPGYPPEPNNSGGNEHCVTLVHDCDQAFNDYQCEAFKLAFVCEKSDVCQ